MDKKPGRKICAGALGVAFGVASGLMMMFFAWASWQWGYGDMVFAHYANVYPGYTPTLVGGFYGLLWGFLVGFVFGFISGFVYNCCTCCCRCSACRSCSCNCGCCKPGETCSR